MPPTTYVVLQSTGQIANKNSTTVPITADSIRTQLRRKDSPEVVGNYKYGKFTLVVYGYKSGKAGTENKHELPPPSDNTLLYGDAYIAAYSDKSLKTSVSFNGDSYAEFYDAAFEGFEELGEEDTEDEESIESEEDEEDAEPAEVEEDEEDEYDEEVAPIQTTREVENELIFKGDVVGTRCAGEECQIEPYTY